MIFQFFPTSQCGVVRFKEKSGERENTHPYNTTEEMTEEMTEKMTEEMTAQMTEEMTEKNDRRNDRKE